jgi:hypothetical protein
MDNLSACSACHSNNGDALPRKIHLSEDLGYGLNIKINDLEAAASSGCRLCTLLSNFLNIFQNLSPDFETSYPKRVPTDLFLQKSDAGTILIALTCNGLRVDYCGLYTQRGEFPSYSVVSSILTENLVRR